MAEELGRIERLSAEQFQGTRKLYLIPLLYAGSDAPPEYQEKYERYWQQVNEQIASQESKVGRVNRIYHESISLGGEDGLKVVERMNILSYHVARDRVDKGAVFESTEIAELVDECMDWERCLLLGFFSQKVAETIAESYRQSAKKRYEHISRRISETLHTGEIALLFIREGHAVQFAQDIDVFSVAPPVLDEIHRWLRDRSRAMEKDTTEETEEP